MATVRNVALALEADGQYLLMTDEPFEVPASAIIELVDEISECCWSATVEVIPGIIEHLQRWDPFMVEALADGNWEVTNELKEI